MYLCFFTLQLKHSSLKVSAGGGNSTMKTTVKCKYGLRQNKRRDSNWEVRHWRVTESVQDVCSELLMHDFLNFSLYSCS